MYIFINRDLSSNMLSGTLPTSLPTNLSVMYVFFFFFFLIIYIKAILVLILILFFILNLIILFIYLLFIFIYSYTEIYKVMKYQDHYQNLGLKNKTLNVPFQVVYVNQNL